MFSNNTVLMRLDGHLTLSIQNCVYDIFNCLGEAVDVAWIVK